MRVTRFGRPALITATVLALAIALRFAVAAPRLSAEIAAPARTSPAAAGSGVTPIARPDSLARIIADRDLFRASRTPAAVRFDPQTADRPPVPQPGPARPAFILSGILLGDQPAALLDGVPGSETTRVLHIGDRFGVFQVRNITPEQVVIAAPDTTWNLRLKARPQ